MPSAFNTWLNKLNFLGEALVTAADAASKFALTHQIEEAKTNLLELAPSELKLQQQQQAIHSDPSKKFAAAQKIKTLKILVAVEKPTSKTVSATHFHDLVNQYFE